MVGQLLLLRGQVRSVCDHLVRRRCVSVFWRSSPSLLPRQVAGKVGKINGNCPFLQCPVSPVDLDDFAVNYMPIGLRNVLFQKMKVTYLACLAQFFLRAGNHSLPFVEKLRVRWRRKKVTLLSVLSVSASTARCEARWHSGKPSSPKKTQRVERVTKSSIKSALFNNVTKPNALTGQIARTGRQTQTKRNLKSRHTTTPQL